MATPKKSKFWSRYPELNQDLLFRREPFYPLNYSEITGSHFMCYQYTNTADQAVPRIRTWSVFFTESLIRLLKRT